jgi:hypothetical protein
MREVPVTGIEHIEKLDNCTSWAFLIRAFD